MEGLLRWRFWQSNPSRAKSSSPLFSTLITLAPTSASWRTHVGPERARVRSITVYGSSGKVMSGLRVGLVGRCYHPSGEESLEAAAFAMDRLRREFWRHKRSANLWAVEVSARDESLLACCGPFTPRVARVVALDELAYGPGPTLDAPPSVCSPAWHLKNDYRTRSMLALPIRDARGDIIGVLQLINARDEAGALVPFSAGAENAIGRLLVGWAQRLGPDHP